MSVEVVMPQMGESITEGTVSKWLKKVGEHVDKDEAVLEISTDKVDAEVPSPGAGVLLEIRHQEGETVEVGTVVGVIGAEGEAASENGLPRDEAPTVVAGGAAQTETETAEPKPAIPETIPSATPAPIAEAEIEVSQPETSKVVMPQMGESITEGTVSKWLKSVGDRIEKDEALLEISTDKVDAEVPSPSAGILLAINVNEGETVEVGAVLALVGTVRESRPIEKAPAEAVKASEPQHATPETMPSPVAALASATVGGHNGGRSVEDLRRTKSSPLVRNIAREHGVDIERILGSGISGRVTKNDILSFIETGAALRPEDLLIKGSPALPFVASPAQKEVLIPKTFTSTEDRVEKMSVMRKKISEHMTISRKTSAHVTSVYEIDMTHVARFRAARQSEFQAKYGTKLSFMPFIFQAVTNAIREYRIINSQVDGDQIIYKGDINLGMAVALDWGLIVPVIRNADTLTLAQLATTANDLADRARTKRLKPDEVQGGTFTITNPGVFGGLFGTPIINQPQVAILCVGTIEKRPKVMTSADGDDYIAIRQMAYFALTYDHRIVDGADAERFLALMKKLLENAEFSI
ncbi:MAG: 2-oxoglutarate dehydrogenase, E2 component, dihydrolipoamide succinyltransferase [Acidobacteriota bacterium]